MEAGCFQERVDMDVGKTLGFTLPLMSFLFLSACGYEMNSSSVGGVNKATDLCAGSAIPNKYIVHWKDGTRSIEHSSGDEAMARNIIAPQRDKIDFVEHDFRVRVLGKPSARSLSESSMSTPDSWGQERISAPDSWTVANGSGIIVAVIDTGVALDHPQLKNQLAINPLEIPNGIDDDKNGFVDDVTGFDFISRTPNVKDNPKSTHHGSHVSGIIVAEHISSSPSIKGIAPGAKLLPLSFLDDYGGGDISDAVDAIDYAVQRGAKVINASWGGDGCSKLLEATVRGLEARGVLFVAAAGNGDQHGIGYNLDSRPIFPGSFGASGQLTVGAMDTLNYMTGFSNFSRNLVHLLAPGARIWSTVYDAGVSSGGNHGYMMMDGTSMATPFVSGAAAMVWSHRPKASVQQIKSALLASITPGAYPVVSGGQLNLRRAIDEIARTVAP